MSGWNIGDKNSIKIEEEKAILVAVARDNQTMEQTI